MSNRRQFLQTLAGGAAGYSLAAAGLAGLRPGTAAAADALAVTHLSDDLLLITGAGANVVALSQPDGVLLVDGGDAEHSAGLLKAISHGFWIFDDTLVLIETLNVELAIQDKEDIALYARLFKTYSEAALHGQQAFDFIATLALELGDSFNGGG